MSIKEIPMLTSDEVEIELNTIIYTTSWSSGYGFKGKAEYKIIPHRVISVDNSRRHFRVRCLKGCETEYQYAKGCSRENLFGRLSSAKEYLQRDILKDISKCRDHISNAMNTNSKLKLTLGEVKSFNIDKLPKEVKL